VAYIGLIGINSIICHNYDQVAAMTETVVLGESGRIVLPAAIRNEFGLKTGDRLTVATNGNRIEILSMDMALKEIRASIIERRGSLQGLLNEFLEERHEEAARERAEHD
jgi:AbrB family looped-hinge helix DNA binding protein